MKHCATDALHAHDRGGWHIFYGQYMMREQKDNLLFYKIKNMYWWDRIDNKKLIYDSLYDKENHIFSNAHLERYRIGYQYVMQK